MNPEAKDPPNPASLPSLFRFCAGQGLALVAATMLVGIALTVAHTAQLPPADGPMLALMVLGSGCGLVSLAAAWLALGPFGWKVRIIAAPLAALGSLTIVAVILALDSPREPIGLAAFIAGGVQFALLQASYWLFRWWLGLRVVYIHDPTIDIRSERFQFRLWEMLLVMTLVAVALGVGRGLESILRGTGGSREIPVIFVLIVGYNLLLAWPLIWSVLSPSGALWKTTMAVGLGLLITVTELPAAESFLGPGPDGFFWMINVPQLVFLFAHLAATRQCGYRLVRQR